MSELDDLVIPDNVLDATEEYDGVEDLGAAFDFKRMLKMVDPRLDLVFAKPGAKAFPKGERWYIVRRPDDGGAAQFWMVEDENGDFCPPDIRHLQRLQEYDTWAHPDVWQKFQQSRIDKKLRAQKAHDDKREEFRTKLGERLAHMYDASIAVTGPMKDLMAGRTPPKPPPLPPRKQKRKKFHHV